MLQSEFFERTKVSLTTDEYRLVEEIYNAVKMGKDDFCKLWLKNRTNKLYNELADAFVLEANDHRADVSRMTRTIEWLQKEFDEYKTKKEAEIEKNNGYFEQQHQEFAKRLIISQSEDYKGYDIIEEEFGIGFIIKTKREAGIPLSDAEIDYMVGKL